MPNNAYNNGSGFNSNNNGNWGGNNQPTPWNNNASNNQGTNYLVFILSRDCNETSIRLYNVEIKELFNRGP